MLSRSIVDYDNGDQADSPPALVLPKEEILPSDIANLKQELFANPNTFDDSLIEQDAD